MKEEEGNARFGHDSSELPTSTTFAVLGDSTELGNKHMSHLHRPTIDVFLPYISSLVCECVCCLGFSASFFHLFSVGCQLQRGSSRWGGEGGRETRGGSSVVDPNPKEEG